METNNDCPCEGSFATHALHLRCPVCDTLDFVLCKDAKDWKCPGCELNKRCVRPATCLHIHAIDGYETYKMDESTIGVRPIWIDVKKSPPPPMRTVLLCVKGEVVVGWNESVQPEEDPSYCSWECWPEDSEGSDGVTHWMPLPKPPESTATFRKLPPFTDKLTDEQISWAIKQAYGGRE